MIYIDTYRYIRLFAMHAYLPTETQMIRSNCILVFLFTSDAVLTVSKDTEYGKTPGTA